jgi:hypothetical protein
MLEPQVVERIRESVEAELRPRDNLFLMRIGAAASEYASAGRAWIGHGQVASEELTARADLIWRIIQRCHTAYQRSPAGESTTAALCQQIQVWINSESNALRELVKIPGANAPLNAGFRQMVVSHATHLVVKYQNEAKFYVEELMKPPKKPEESHSISVGINYGTMAVAAGSGAQARVDAAGNAQLIAALEQLRAAFQQSATMPADKRGDSLGVVDDAIIAARAPDANKFTLLGLLKGVGAAVSLMADAPDAWQSVRGVASTLGLHLD